MDEIYTRLASIFRDVFDDDTIILTPQLAAKDVEDWDSLTHIRLMLAVQKAFNTTFSAAQISQLSNVGELVDLIRAKASSK